MTRIIQISDTHIVAGGKLANGIVDTQRALALAVETIIDGNHAIGPVDLVIVTGDLTDHGLQEEYDAFLELIDPLKDKLVAIPGNHDHRDRMREAFADAPWMPADGPLNIRIDLPSVTIIGLDTQVSGQPHGEICPVTLDWFAAQLATLDQQPLLLSMHHPPIRTGIALMDGQGLRNADAISELLVDFDQPCHIIAGHAHRSVTSTFASHPTIICPGTSHAVYLDLGSEKNDNLVFEPGGFVLHEIGGSITSHLIPVGRFDGPYPFRA